MQDSAREAVGVGGGAEGLAQLRHLRRVEAKERVALHHLGPGQQRLGRGQPSAASVYKTSEVKTAGQRVTVRRKKVERGIDERFEAERKGRS